MRVGFAAVGLIVTTTMIAGPGAQAERPLPDKDAFLAATRARLAANGRLQQGYRYKERSTELNLNPFGQMGTGVVELFEVFPAVEDDLTYRRLIARDGQPLPADEVARQDRDYVEKYRAWQRRVARAGAGDRQARAKREAAARDKERALAEEVLNLFDFTLERREMLRGEPAIVVKFVPRPNVRARSREARVARAFSGRAWVHEHEHEVMQLEGTSADDVAFGFGIVARLNEGAKVKITRRRELGTWLPDETRFSGTGRALLLRKVDVEYVRQYFDYAPFDPNGPPPIPGLGGQGKP